jgi:hypothetical protein
MQVVLGLQGGSVPGGTTAKKSVKRTSLYNVSHRVTSQAPLRVDISNITLLYKALKCLECKNSIFINKNQSHVV